MGENDIHSAFPSISIPKLFQPFLEDHPFEQCIVCQCDLLTGNTQCLIEKAFKGNEVIFEYALCADCSLNLRQELSQTSMERMQEAFDRRAQLVERRRRLDSDSAADVLPWIDRCIMTGVRRQDTESYQLCAHCIGDQLILSDLPFMISGAAMNEMAHLLSRKTRETLDDFTDEYLGMPPEFKELFDDVPALLF